MTRLYVKAFTQDGSSKALMVEESMTCGKKQDVPKLSFVFSLFFSLTSQSASIFTGRVSCILADKNHVQLTQKWALLEHLPHLHMGK